MESPQRFSLFLTPCVADYGYLEKLIRDASAACGTTPFEPHVTVYSASYTDLEEVKVAVARAVKGVEPFPLRITGIGIGLEYFKSLFLEFEESPLLRGIHDRLKRGLAEDSGYRLVPHLSLLYGDISLAEKEALARRIVPDRGEILFDRVKVVAPQNPDEGWRDTDRWRAMLMVRLGGGAPRGR